jgi:hypothetical protein
MKLLGSFFAFLSATPYIITILRGHTLPVRVTWGLWSLILWVGFAAQWQLESWDTLTFVLIDALQVTFIFALSVWYGAPGWSRIDTLCLVISLLAIITWRLTADPAYALYLMIMADLVAAVPTFVHAYTSPHEENGIPFLLFSLGGIFTFMSNVRWDFHSIMFPLYLTVLNLCIGSLILVRKWIPATDAS